MYQKWCTQFRCQKDTVFRTKYGVFLCFSLEIVLCKTVDLSLAERGFVGFPCENALLNELVRKACSVLRGVAQGDLHDFDAGAAGEILCICGAEDDPQILRQRFGVIPSKVLAVHVGITHGTQNKGLKLLEGRDPRAEFAVAYAVCEAGIIGIGNVASCPVGYIGEGASFGGIGQSLGILSQKPYQQNDRFRACQGILQIKIRRPVRVGAIAFEQSQRLEPLGFGDGFL